MIDSNGERPIIFTDVDGCLNRHQRHGNGYCGVDADCIAHFNRVLAETDANIVVSSAWRYLFHSGSHTLAGMESLLLTHGLNCHRRIVDVTCRDEVVAQRGRQISQWLRQYGSRPYVVLDNGGTDEDGRWYDLGIRRENHPVVWCDGYVGLTADLADLMIAVLNRVTGYPQRLFEHARRKAGLS